ncbi:MAG: ATP-binding cassette domain-containing protein, partial [Euzebyales bacterium]|nr:ATP-binding cassette domain-containing protein [Euzebyales bacterium]
MRLRPTRDHPARATAHPAEDAATDPAGGPDLVISDLVIAYSSGGYEVRPIDGLDLRVESGQLVLLLGASGCGKTTLLSALASILSPTAGSIRLGDVE